ncbi:hypothetical protein PLICRDRAFT_180042 [Plicaturopsis crispa FD-325 SS-3]|uniref:F-box domain-containing protein n=1 Tax=Plicaturopsis crispa FD-325 SS-3 TaxID=944288 RepID=A0A0C9SKN1_PLICR|nr:hypothetical protein PLICRDRAFT_180042 [Plicaturopsis crispa FD-325 SS-3]
MARRRTKRSRAHGSTVEPAHQLNDADRGTISGSATRRKKRAATAGAGRASGAEEPIYSGARGGLENLTKMPLDILLEIFERLRPLDVLHLARTSKALRGLLMHRRTAISVWRAAFSNFPGIPDCPPDLNEPQYANLVFSEHCHSCLKPDATVYWIARVRYCWRCAEERAVPLDDFVLIREHITVQPVMERRLVSMDEMAPDQCFIVGDIAAFTRALNALPSEDEKQAFKQESTKRKKEIEDHAKACEAWARKVQAERIARLPDEVKIIEGLVERYNMGRPLDEPVLSVADVCLLPPFNSIITDAPPDITITEASFSDAMRLLPQLTAEWYDASIARLEESLAHDRAVFASRVSQHYTAPTIDLATSWFQCSACRDGPYHGRDATMHRHEEYIPYRWQPDSVHCSLSTLVDNLPRVPWRGEKLKPVYGLAYLIHMCGMDPNVITAAEMDELDPWVLCRTCEGYEKFEKGAEGEVRVFNWRTAVKHALRIHGPRPNYANPEVWWALDEEKTRCAREKARLQCDDAAAKMYVCMRCRERMQCGVEDAYLKTHARDVHRISAADMKPGDFALMCDSSAPHLDNIMLRWM